MGLKGILSLTLEIALQLLQKRLRSFHVLLLFLCVCDFFHLLLSILCFSLQHLSTDYRNHVQCHMTAEERS